MAQHDYNLANQSGADFRADLNDALAAIVTVNSGATSPSTTFAHQLWVDTANSVLKIRNSANDAWITTGVSITADNTFDINGGTVNGITSFSFSTGSTVTSILDEDDLSSDSATALATQQSIKAYVDSQVGSVDTLAEILLNGNTTGGTDIEFGDNDKAIFGTGSDLKIYHDGSNSYIQDSGTGNLRIAGQSVDILNPDANEFKARFLDNGAAELYYDNSKKLATTNTGIDVTGTVVSDGLTVDGDATLSDANPTLSLVDTTATNQGAEFTHNAGTTTIKSSNTSTHGVIKFNSNNGTDTVTRMQIDRFGDISFYDDTGTTQGLFWDASTERLGIGTTSPATKLSVDGGIIRVLNGSNITFYEEDKIHSYATSGYVIDGREGLTLETTTADTDIILNPTGSVGIGTDSPSKKLHVQNGSSGFTSSYNSRTAAIIEGSASNGTALSIMSPSTGVSVVYFGDESQEYSGQVSYDHSVNSMRFFVSGGERARIDASGRMGIGTSSPSAKLDVEGTAQVNLLDVTHTGDRAVNFTRTGANSFSIEHDLNQFYFWNQTTSESPLLFQNDGDVIMNAGNVGIGISSPSRIFTVENNSGIFRINTSTSTYPRIEIGSASGTTAAVINRTTSTQDIKFGETSDTGNYIFRGGNVGIGTDSPSLPLSVAHTSTTAYATSKSFNVGGAVQIVNQSNTAGTFASLELNAGTAFAATASISVINENGSSNSASTLTFATRQSGSNNIVEAMRIDSSQNLLVGTTSTATNSTTEGFFAKSEGLLYAGRSGDAPIIGNRITNDGDIAIFRKDGSTVGSIGSSFGNRLYIGDGDTAIRFADDLDTIVPWNGSTNALRDNAIDLGESSGRFQDIYASNGTIQTSDINEKQDIEDLSEAETRVAVAAKGLLKKYRWKSAVADKGDDARIHFGIMAQDLENAFANEGLDAGDYGMFISSTWTDEATGEEKTRLGVRYNELLAFIIAAI